MKKIQKGFIVPLLIVIVVLALSGSVYYVSQKNADTSTVVTPIQTNEETPPQATQVAPSSETISSEQTIPVQSNTNNKSLRVGNEKIKLILADNVLRGMEDYFDNHNVFGDSKNPMVNYGTSFANGNCYAANTAFSDSETSAAIQTLLTIYGTGGSIAKISCWNNGDKWAISASLLIPESSNSYWCMDNSTKGLLYSHGVGVSKAISASTCI